MSATTLQHFLFLRLPVDALSELTGESPDHVIQKTETSEQLFACRAYVGANVADLRRGFEKLESTGSLARNSVQTLLSVRANAALDRARLSPAEFDEYLDILPIAEEHVKIVSLHTPERLSSQESEVVKRLLREGHPLQTAKDLQSARTTAHTVVLLLAPQLFGVSVDARRAAALFSSFAPVATTQASKLNTAQRNTALLSALSSYGAQVLTSLAMMAPASKKLEASIPGIQWPSQKSVELEDAAKRVLSRPFRIAFYGRFSAGKSSLINALLSSYLLPTSDQPTTATIHSISFGEGADELTTVRFKSAEEVAQDIDDILRICGFPGEGEQIGDLTDATGRLEDVFLGLSSLPSLTDEQRRLIRDTRNAIDRDLPRWRSYLGTTSEWNEQQLGEVICGSGPTFLILDVTTRRNISILAAGLQLIDLPGVDSMTPSHARIADHVIREADAVVYTMNAQQAFSTFDHERLRRLYEQREAATVILCASRIDQAENPDEVVRSVIAQHEKAFPGLKPTVVPISGLLGMCSRLGINDSLKDLANQNIYSEYRKYLKSAPGLSHLDWLELSNILALEASIGVLAERRRGVAVATSVLSAIDEYQREVINECDLLFASWDFALKQSQTQLDRAQAGRARLLELAEVSKTRLTEMASVAANRAKDQLNSFATIHAMQMAEDYLAEYREIRKLIGANGALAFLDDDIFLGFRKIFEQGIGAQQKEVLDHLGNELQSVRDEAAKLARTIEANSFAALTGISGEIGLGRRETPPTRLTLVEEEVLQAARTVTDALFLALDPTGSFGARLLRQKADVMVSEFTKQSLGIVSANVDRLSKQMGRLAVTIIQKRVMEADARLCGFLEQAKVLGERHSAWSDGLREYVDTISTIVAEVKNISWTSSATT